jgi:hypothetical protein
MKIATRIALLQFQVNPADPANLWRLMIAWFTPGMREEPREAAVGTAEPLRPALRELPAKRTDTIPLIQRSRRVLGQITLHPRSALIGAVVGMIVGAGAIWFLIPNSQQQDEQAARVLCKMQTLGQGNSDVWIEKFCIPLILARSRLHLP